jgi:hypothetical protein
MNMKLVHRLATPDEVPEQLREKFETVARIAGGDSLDSTWQSATSPS